MHIELPTESDPVRVLVGDCVEQMRTLPDGCVQTCVTSPPYYGLRNYGCAGQIGLEETPDSYVAKLVAVFREVRRVLRGDGTLWLNIGDSYAAKNLIGIPWRVAFALQADGWFLRQDCIWHKPSPMPSSVRDRFTTAHEYMFLLSPSPRYFFDAEAVKEVAVTAGKTNLGFSAERAASMGRAASGNELTGGRDVVRGETRNKRDVWSVESESNRERERECIAVLESDLPAAEKWAVIRSLIEDGCARPDVWRIATKPFKGAHFAVMPPELVRPCVRAGSSEEGCCPTCGKPWERVVERGASIRASDENRFATNKKREDGHQRNDGGTIGNMNGAIYARHKAANPDKFLGWRPACTCGGSPVPCTVLDPFGGSGTTGLVALEEGRRAILCELNPEYAEMARKRLAERCDKGLFADVA